jgi:hypothetical protein
LIDKYASQKKFINIESVPVDVDTCSQSSKLHRGGLGIIRPGLNINGSVVDFGQDA